MARIETWFNQDLQNAVKVHYIDGNVFSADKNGNVVGVNVFDGGARATLTGSVSGSVIRADGNTVAVVGTLSGNKASIVLPQAAYAVPGVISIVIKLTSGSDITTLCAAVANVYMSATDSAVDPGTIIPSVETLIAEIEAAVASIPADYSSLWQSLAPTFSTSDAYSIGQFVTYNGGLYRFKTPHAAGTWNANHVDAVTVGGAINADYDKLDAFYGQLKKNVKIETPVLSAQAGKAWDSTGALVDLANHTAFEFPVSYPQEYILTGLRISLDSLPIFILDSSNNILASYLNYPDYATYQKYIYTVPNAAKIRYTSYTNSTWDKPPHEIFIPRFADTLDLNIEDAYAMHNTATLEGITTNDAVPVSFTVSNGFAGAAKNEKITFGTQDYWKHTKISGVSQNDIYIVKIIRTATSVATGYVAFVDANDVVLGYILKPDTTDSRSKNNVVVIPQGVSGFYVNSFTNVDSRLEVYKVTQTYAKAETDTSINKDDIARAAMADNCYDKFQQVEVTKTTGKMWNDNAQMIDDANGTAFECAAKEMTRYRLTGLRIGIDRPVFFLDANGAILERYLPGAQTANFYLDVITPKNCTLIRYSSYTNSSWDINPTMEVAYAWLPAYYYANGYIDNKIEEIRTATKFVNGVAFIFITDLHFNYNAKNSLYLMKEVLNKTSVPFVVCGGDIPGAYGTEDNIKEAGNLLTQWQSYIGAWRFFNIRGNHDFTIKTNSSMASREPNTGATLPVGYAYDYIMREQDRFLYCSAPENMAWYLEIPQQKMRLVGINSCDGQMTDTTASWGVDEKITQAQVDWLLANAVNKPDYTYIFLSHITSDPDMGLDHYGQEVIQALLIAMANHTNFSYSDGSITASKDFTGYTDCKVACHISGHAHTDTSHLASNVLSIITTCDAYYLDDGHGAVRGTITEHAFDVFCIDFDQRTINAIRIGRGDNRSWSY